MAIIVDDVEVGKCNGVIADDIPMELVFADGTPVHDRDCYVPVVDFRASDNNMDLGCKIRFTWTETPGNSYNLYDGSTMIANGVHSGYIHNFGSGHTGTFKVHDGTAYSNSDSGTAVACWSWNKIEYVTDKENFKHSMLEYGGTYVLENIADDITLKGWTIKARTDTKKLTLIGPCGQQFTFTENANATICNTLITSFLHFTTDDELWIEAGRYP